MRTSLYTKIQQGRRATINAAAMYSASDRLDRAHANIIDAENIAPRPLKARITAIANELAALRNDIAEGKF